MTNRVPDFIIYMYVAFLKNYIPMTIAIEKYYSDPISPSRARLVQTIALKQRGSLSQRIIMAEKVMPILDQYNTTSVILHEWMEDIDFSYAELLTVLNKAGIK